MEIDELKTLIRTEAHVQATFAAVDADYQPAKVHFEALGQRRDQLQSQLDAIAEARAELARLRPPPPVPEETVEEVASETAESSESTSPETAET